MRNSRSALGLSVMTIVPLLQLGTEYLSTGGLESSAAGTRSIVEIPLEEAQS